MPPLTFQPRFSFTLFSVARRALVPMLFSLLQRGFFTRQVQPGPQVFAFVREMLLFCCCSLARRLPSYVFIPTVPRALMAEGVLSFFGLPTVVDPQVLLFRSLYPPPPWTAPLRRAARCALAVRPEFQFPVADLPPFFTANFPKTNLFRYPGDFHLRQRTFTLRLSPCPTALQKIWEPALVIFTSLNPPFPVCSFRLLLCCIFSDDINPKHRKPPNVFCGFFHSNT